MSDKHIIYKYKDGGIKPYAVKKFVPNWFYVENLTNANNSLMIKKYNSSAPSITIEYSFNGVQWKRLGTTSTSYLSVTIPANSKVYLRCKTNTWKGNFPNKITCPANFGIGGNVLSLFYGDEFTGSEKTIPDGGNFAEVFSECSTLITCENLLLPEDASNTYAFSHLFTSCRYLTTAFSNLPTTKYGYSSFDSMFYGCTSLVNVSFTLTSREAGSQSFHDMFYGCTSLTSSPLLDITGTTTNSYTFERMFYGCSNLSNITCLGFPSNGQPFENWVSGVAATGTFTKSANVTQWTTGVNGIPSGWTVVDV